MITNRQKGFTLVELMLAMAFFSFILLFATTGFILVNRSYNKGLTVKLVQDEARAVMERFSREIRVTPSQGIITQADCFSLVGDSYYWTDRVDDTDSNSPKQLLFVEGVECTNIAGSDPAKYSDGMVTSDLESVSILNERVGVQSLELSNNGGRYSIRIVLSTTATDLIDTSGDISCKSVVGDQFCDVVELSTVVAPL